MRGEEIFLQALERRILESAKSIKASEILFHCKIPVDKHWSKKNGKRAFVVGKGPRTRAIVTHSNGYSQAENFMVSVLRAQGNKLQISKPFDCDLWFMCIFGFKNYHLKGKAIRSERVNDLSNLLEHPQDCLQKAGIIENDSQICSLDLSRRVPSSENFVEMFLIKYNSSI